MNDASFARFIFERLKPNGRAYIISNNERFARKHRGKGASGFLHFLSFKLNELLHIKIGHPHPVHARLKRLFEKLPFQFCEVSRLRDNTVVKVIK